MSALDELAARAGITDRYTDVWGADRVVSADTKAALLAAMGIAAHGPEETARALDRLAQQEWHRVLPAVHTLTADEAGTIALTLPADSDAVSWTLTFEHGAALRGAARWTSLPRRDAAAVDGRPHERRLLPIDPLPAGYHTLSIVAGERDAATILVAAPQRCWLPPVLRRAGGNRVWGVAAQLYGVRSARNWGIGDFTDLTELAERAAALGAQLIGINPLHALFPEAPERCSPYAPSSRLFLNPLYLDVERVDGFDTCAEARAMVATPDFQGRLEALRAAPLVDYPGVMAAKRPVLELLYRHFLRAGDPVAFQAFRTAHGVALERHVVFEALSEHFAGAPEPARWWGEWPAAYHDPASPAVAAFAAEHAERIGFFAWLQWQADRQLAAAQVAARRSGMAIGLYRDLAVGADRAGAETWLDPARWADGATIGAPPDHYNPAGQDWGLPPLRPEDALRPLIALLRANMARAGALRIDHAFALMRLFWVPAGHAADQGAYVAYPFEALLAAVKLESQRNRCLVIGEDLGTVPPGFREACAAAGILSYRLLYFERDPDQGFTGPAHYPALALAAASTHDLPTVGGWWHAHDIALRETLALYPSRDLLAHERAERARDRERLRAALAAEGLLEPGADGPAVPARAIQRYLARSRAAVMMVQLEDVLGLDEQANLPGTIEQHPNWRRKLPAALDALTAPGGPLADLAAVLEAERPRGSSADDRLALPGATYRVQLHKGFTLHDAAALVPYLAELGVTHLYASPYLTARPGSSHGYDIVDHTGVNPELGGEAGLRALTDALAHHAMGHILDVVPNHMGIGGADNAWWLDVLEWGEASRYAGYFDIDWRPRFGTGQAKLLLPILAGHYGDVLAAGALQLKLDAGEGGFSVWYFGHRLPVCPVDYPAILAAALAHAGARPAADPAIGELAALIDEFRTLDGPRDAARDDRPADAMKLRLADLIERAPAVGAALAAAIADINTVPRPPDGLPALHEILEAQHYRVAFWRVASEINYRRFFDINDLAGLRMENRALFDHAHRLVFQLIDAGRLHGLRVDHIDGLADPAQYCQRIQERAGPELYLVVEKILAAHEHLPAGWPIAGTTGYDALNQINGLFVSAAAERGLDRVYRRFTGRTDDFDSVLHEAKLQVLRNNLASELQVLSLALKRIADADPRTRDHTHDALDRALADTIAWFPVYRTYVTARAITPEDRQHIDWAIGRAARRSQLPDLSVYEFLRGVLTLEHRPADGLPELLEFVRKFQQLTGPVMAKGFEDTGLYRYTRLVSLNEVGGDPRRFGVSIAAFHHLAERRAATMPHALIASASHDTKRGEDVRARLDVLSEMPAAWGSRVTRWSRMNRLRRRTVDDRPAPGRDDEYLIYQTLVGAWPPALDEPAPGPGLDAYVERLTAYLVKALREAKLRTSWIQPNAAYETAATEFVRRILDARRANPFLADLAGFVRRIAPLGATNGLAQTVIKLTMPGVPDIYQGCELWDFSLVDPDNRRAVDYGLRRRALADHAAIDDLMAHWPDGRIKQRVIRTLLHHRRAHPALYREGAYEPVAPRGTRAAQLLAFRRRLGEHALLVLVPVLTAALVDGGGFPVGADVWRDTAVPAHPTRAWRDLFTGALIEAADEMLPVATALSRLPIACLEPVG